MLLLLLGLLWPSLWQQSVCACVRVCVCARACVCLRARAEEKHKGIRTPCLRQCVARAPPTPHHTHTCSCGCAPWFR